MSPRNKVIVRNILVSPVLLVRVPLVIASYGLTALAKWVEDMADLLPALEHLPMTDHERLEQQQKVIDGYLSLTDRRK